MFYKKTEDFFRASVVFKPEESKKLIARAIAGLPEVSRALDDGIVIVAGGTTNAYIARELTRQDIDINRFTAGRIFNGILDATPIEERLKPVILVKGQRIEMPMSEALDKFTGNDVFIKGANAVDPEGNAGVLAASEVGGTVGAFWALAVSRGANVICPVGLEKLIPSVPRAVMEAGQDKFDFNMGKKVGLLQLSGARVVTEIEAMEILYGLEAVQIAAGGIGGSEGSVVLSVKGDESALKTMWNDLKELKIFKDY